MKSVYIDEAGIGGEPWTIVAGVMIDPDLQWQDLKSYLADVAKAHLLPEDQDGIVFHATEIWHGKRRFSRKKYSREARRELLADICRIPKVQGLPICLGVVENSKYAASYPDKSNKDVTIEAHCIAYANCVCLIDSLMKGHGSEDELVTLFLENNDQAKAAIRQVQIWLASSELVEHLGDHEMAQFLPITRVIDVPHFVEKADSPIMQIADACAFVINRFFAEKEDVDDLMAEIRPQIVLPLGDGAVGLR